MDKALYIAMTGAKHNMMAQTNHANNLANLSTSGFRADLTQARSMPVFYGDGIPTRAYALTESPGVDFSTGPLIETGRELDIAIEGEGFIAVQAPDGREAYTRSGSLFIDSVGIVRTGSGLPVLGNGGPIALPPAEKVEVAIDGTITVVPAGDAVAQVAQVDRIRLVNPNQLDLEKSADGLLRARQVVEEIPVDANIRVISGFLEGSNVNAVNELTSMLSLARQYEMQVKIMQTAKENSETSARLLQMNS